MPLKHNEKSSEARKDWVWYDKMDAIFGVCKNIAPSFIANRSIDIEEDKELLDNKSKFSKKQKKIM
ncbi:21317_t:CDS:2 [Rhizophagus irregularis]|nr:21317_t:CDS:2 [Rhizophagus irregularis]